MFEGKKILITGGTGSLGQALTKRLLKLNVDTIRILSRNEGKQVSMESKFKDDRLRFIIGDIRDLPRLIRATEGIDIVFHTAALKHVPVIEYNPFESIQTNVVGTQNVIDACIHENVKIAIAIGTDKAVSPLNTYGATKLLMEKLFVAAHNYVHPPLHQTKFLAIRYGNVLGSDGSVVPKFIHQIKNNEKITITDPNMTRFSITMDEALDFILDVVQNGQSGGIFVPKLKAFSVGKLKEILFEIFGKTDEEIISSRPGEKMHEILINEDEMRYAWEFKNNYILFDPLLDKTKITASYDGIKPTSFNNPYSSDYAEIISDDELKKGILGLGIS